MRSSWSSSSSLSPSSRVIQLPASSFKEKTRNMNSSSNSCAVLQLSGRSCFLSAWREACRGRRAVVVSLCVTSSRCLGRLHGNLRNMLTPASCLTVSLLLSVTSDLLHVSLSSTSLLPTRLPKRLAWIGRLQKHKHERGSTDRRSAPQSEPVFDWTKYRPVFVSVDVAFLSAAEQQLTSALRALINQTQLLNR